MELDHPPVEALRLGARAAALCGLFAGAVQIVYTALPLTFSLGTVAWALLAGVLFSATVIALLIPKLELQAGATLATAAVLATFLGGGVQFGTLLGWNLGYALLFLASGLFTLSAWGWDRRAAAVRGRPVPVEDAEHTKA